MYIHRTIITITVIIRLLTVMMQNPKNCMLLLMVHISNN